MAILDFANIDMDILFPVVCMKDYDDDRQDLYYKRLLRSTLFPLAVLLALILLYQYQKWHLVNSKLASNKRGQKIRDLRSTIFYVSLFFSFVILPPTSRTVFEFFATHEFPESNSCYLCKSRPSLVCEASCPLIRPCLVSL